MARKLTRQDHKAIWRFLQSGQPATESAAPDGRSDELRVHANQTMDAAKLQATVDVYFGVGTLLLAIMLLVTLLALPQKSFTWAFFLGDLMLVGVAVWHIDRGNRRLKNLARSMTREVESVPPSPKQQG